MWYFIISDLFTLSFHCINLFYKILMIFLAGLKIMSNIKVYFGDATEGQPE